MDDNRDRPPALAPSFAKMRDSLRHMVEVIRRSFVEFLTIPTLVIGAQHDTMDPTHMEWMATAVQRGRYLHCPEGSHMAMYDDQQTYMHGLIDFIHDVDAGRFER